MLVYIDLASYVNIFALGSIVPRLSIIFLNSKESLRYVFIAFAIGWSFMSTYFPMGFVTLAQSEHTGLVGTGLPGARAL